MRTTRLIASVVTTSAVALTLAIQAPSADARPAESDPPIAPVSPLSTVEPPTVAATHHTPRVDAAREATKMFRSPERARKHGYALFHDVNGIACISMPGMGGMGVHFVNSDLVGNPEVLRRKPEALVYDRENGHRRLVALEYLVLRRDWNKAHGAHAARPMLFGHRFNLTLAGNRFGLPAFYSLHAWVWKHNPDGRFAMWNPNVHCACCPSAH